ncbi:MAG: glutathione S-transferase N-terminal domain-containing protein [Alphaproteobacteria bacterium]|nr:glutathione S-transferase N-terminal domain-containing protein [Alphaproteobacteria bacterium]
MKLFYAPGTCALAPHILLEEIGRPFEAVRLDFTANEQRSAAYLELNPRGRVPLLVTEQGSLRENVAISLYLADLEPARGLLPSDPWRRAQAISVMSWMSGTVHGQAFAGWFRAARFTDDPAAQETVKAKGRADALAHLAEMDAMLAGKTWFTDERFTAADPMFMILRRWGIRIGLDVSPFKALAAHSERLAARPAVARVLEREGIRFDA